MTAMRVFFGIGIPPAQRSALALQQFLLPLPKRADPEDFHLTLCFLGEITPAEVEVAHDAALGMRMPGFSLVIEGFGLFGGARPRVAFAGVRPCAGLDRLQARLQTALYRARLRPDARRFMPHVTLGRFRPPAPDEALRLERAVALSQVRLDPFRVDDFAFFRSHPTASAGRYQVLARYPLLPDAV